MWRVESGAKAAWRTHLERIYSVSLKKNRRVPAKKQPRRAQASLGESLSRVGCDLTRVFLFLKH